MKVKITHPCWVGGKPYKIGDVVEVKENDAKTLIGMGRAKKVEAASAQTTMDEGKKAKGGAA